MSTIKEYMLDSCVYTGDQDDLISLEYLTKMIDKHTEIVKLDFTDMGLCHYIGHGGKMLTFIEMLEDTRLKVYKRPDGQYDLIAGEILNIPIREMKEEGLHELAQEVYLDEEDHGTMFHNLMYDDNAEYFFVSGSARKTMQLRVTNNIPVSSMERDLFLRRTWYDEISKEAWVVTRRSGRYAKIISCFAGKPSRIGFKDAVDFAKEQGKIVAWSFTQTAGLQLVLTISDEIKAVREKYPDLEYTPCHIISVCDSGHFSNSIASGWMLKNSPKWFITSRTIVKKPEKLNQSMEASSQSIYEDMEMLGARAAIHGDLTEMINTICQKSRLMKESLGSVREIQRQAENDPPVNTRELMHIFTKNLDNGTFHGISEYIEGEMIQRIMGEIAKLIYFENRDNDSEETAS